MAAFSSVEMGNLISESKCSNRDFLSHYPKSQNAPKDLIARINTAHVIGANVRAVSVGLDGDWFLKTDRYNGEKCSLPLPLLESTLFVSISYPCSRK